MTHINLKSKQGKTLTMTIHAQERQIDRGLLSLNLQAALDRAVTLTNDNIKKHAHLTTTFFNKMSSYDQSHIKIMVNPFYNVQFRIDSTNGNIVTLVKYK